MKENQVVAPPPGQRPAPKSADQQRSPGQTWHDGRFQEKPWAAKNKDGHVHRYKVQQNALQHAQTKTKQESSMPMGKPVSQMRRPAQDPKMGKFDSKMSVKSKTADNMVASRDVDTFDRGGEVGRPHMEGANPVSVIARYATLGRALKTNESFSKVAQQIAQIADMAEQTVMQEAGDWFDQHTIKRNMKEMKNYASQFTKIAEELDTLQQRATALYDDMGNVLTRYFEINDSDEGGEEGEEGEEGETPATSPERTEFDNAAADMGNSDQQGWTEQDQPEDDYDPTEPPDDDDEESEMAARAGRTEGASYPPGYFTHDEDDTEEDKEETEKMKATAQKAVANRFPKPKQEAAPPWATGEEKKWSNAKLAQELRDAKDALTDGSMNRGMAEKWLEILSKEAKSRGVKEGRGFALPGQQSAKDNFKTQGLEGEARGDIANFGPKKQKAFSGSNQPTREARIMIAKEFAQNPATLNRVINTLKKNEIKSMLKSGKAHNLREARKLIAMEAINRFAGAAKKLMERGPVKEAPAPAQKIAQLTKIAESRKSTKIEGRLVDSFSASAILAVYRSLNEENRSKFVALPIQKMATMAFQLVK